MSSPLAPSFQYHRLRHELGNYAAMRMKATDGAIISMHQSGTHWLKFMLASAMAVHYGVAAPRYNHANDIIGGLKDERPPPPLPWIVSTHSVAPLVFKLPYLLNSFPPLIVLVRDLRDALASNYRKWQTRYAEPFSDYLRGDPSGRRYNSDIWWSVRFQNAWGALAQKYPQQIRVVRYEDLRAEPHSGLARVAAHLGLSLSANDINVGVSGASKTAMAAKADPARPRGEVNSDDAEPPFHLYEASDKRFLEACLESYLHYSFGYDYGRWEGLA